MFFRAPEAHSRSFLKAVSWRLLGSMDTFVISFFVTGKLTFALSIASVETFTKIMLYYFHERLWAAVPWGSPARPASGELETGPVEPLALKPATAT